MLSCVEWLVYRSVFEGEDGDAAKCGREWGRCGCEEYGVGGGPVPSSSCGGGPPLSVRPPPPILYRIFIFLRCGGGEKKMVGGGGMIQKGMMKIAALGPFGGRSHSASLRSMVCLTPVCYAHRTLPTSFPVSNAADPPAEKDNITKASPKHSTDITQLTYQSIRTKD